MLNDLRYTCRVLLKQRGFTVIAVSILALGIGVNTAIFSLVNAVLLRPLPIPDPGRVVIIDSTVRRDEVERRSVSYPDFLDWRAQRTALDRMAAFDGVSFTVAGRDRSERVEGELVSAAYFEILGARPVRGRTFRPDEDEVPDAADVAVVRQRFWEAYLGADPNVVGSRVKLNGRDFTIVGVLPGDFRGLDDDTDVWVPMSAMSVAVPRRYLENRSSRWMSVVARLKPGVSVARAQADMDTIARRLELAYPAGNTNYGAVVIPLAD